jgi:hypothetical protein
MITVGCVAATELLNNSSAFDADLRLRFGRLLPVCFRIGGKLHCFKPERFVFSDGHVCVFQGVPISPEIERFRMNTQKISGGDSFRPA